ncbi:glycerol-3-phosphate 1-O-acyltransferase [Shewanella sp. Choline-02u-19]|uniref:glycerol-3-phosphate 1-O-acyltransferase PlsB n=1 Tax=unclassified Shewanella TaxID=196818 RepID=UPI000C33C700|nr:MULTISPECIES: glycerol-3-phosphate 1-O-acyltransferase PlsB [unclassified Shewanella]PKG55665.1 glycerol-3-phosphate 1-O-acyltransferase [Shewanella sp. GutDb-MelDb]PKG72788.1 glycerol-3-phosphate 1-O-acyltransferase [Shewanella sp. GutCb]PKH57214.1 glycerol-3-phosphate 1-O-acyltransferase [Shewanella sp. Bg11-22]PKI29671.1 glycerol-3-phosphate 1-O-acyltransferase [Shewanella sp. Choline-02u-19]
MSKKDSLWFKSLRWIQKKLVHTIVVPHDPFEDLNLDPSKPLVYVMKTESVSDIAALSEITGKFGLPSPYNDLEVNGVTAPRVVCLEGSKPLFGERESAEQYLHCFKRLLSVHKQNEELDIQLVPVSLYWGRTPGKEDDTMRAAVLERQNPTWLRKCLMILFLGRHNFVQFSNAVSLRYMADEHGTDKRIAQKLARVARVHFQRQRKVMTGPQLPKRQALFHALLKSESITRAIKEEATNKKISESEARAKAMEYLDEVAADYSDSLVRITERFLTWLWNKLYKGINIKGAEQVRQLHHDGHEIVYVPCHRSHMDYLLLSYILYYQGMVPPHIAAGINLNFWPAGPMFRRGGAFFIRRSFRGNKLYTAVFREYLDQLFTKGYPVEYFTEGGRSRTGRLLAPKTGMIAMTLNSVLRGVERPVTLVPVYLGYDHVMEVATYHKELSGKKKKKESVWQVFGAIRKLGNFGQGYVNFGKPITLHNFLNDEVPTWREDIVQDPEQKQPWFTPAVNKLAREVMTNINDAAAVSAVTLTSLVLLASEQNALERSQLEKQLDLYLTLLKELPYTEYTSVPEGSGKDLVSHGLELKKIKIESDSLGDIISIDDSIAITMTYYRNNIIHLMVVPSLIAACLLRKEQCTRDDVLSFVSDFYPLLKAELFMGIEDPAAYTHRILDIFVAQGLVAENGHFTVADNKVNKLLLLSGTIDETMQRYAILFNLLAVKPNMERSELERDSHRLAQRLGALHGITAPEFYDKKLYATLSVKLKELGHLTDSEGCSDIKRIKDRANLLLRSLVRQTIVDSVNAEQNS